MLESELVLRWVSLDMVATCALVQPPAANDVGMQLMLLIQQRPSIGTSGETKAGWRAECAALEGRLDAAPFDAAEVERLAEEFSKLRERLEGLEEYLRDKIECYAAMLESV